MSIVHESQRRRAILKRPQADYNTPGDTTDLTKWVGFEATDKNFATLTPKVSDNTEDSTGRDQPTQEFLESWDAESPIDFGVSSEMIGYILLLVFGQVTTTQPDSVGAPTVYQHVFTPVDPAVAHQLLTTSLVEIVGSAINRLLPSMAAEDFSLKGDGDKRIEGSVKLRGSGRETTPSGLVVADMDTVALTGQHFFFNSQAQLAISDAVTLANAVNYYQNGRRMATWQFGVNNKPLSEEGYVPGAGKFQDDTDWTTGAVRSELLFGKREFTASTMVRLLSQSDEHAALKTRKLLDWLLTLRGALITAVGPTKYYHQLKIEAPRVRYNVVEYKPQNGLIYCDVQPKLFDAAGSNPLAVTLQNTVASYTN